MNRLKQIDLFLNKIEGALLIGLLSVMMVLAFLQVVLRNLFATGIIWADVLLRHLLLWVGFLGAALATSQERHINIDALRKFLPPRLRCVIELLTDLFAAAVCLLLLKASWVFVQSEIADQRTFFANIPSWYLQSIIPVGFGLLAAHFVIRAILRVQSLLIKGTPQ
jgi:TRAP-type C4-dicarboxylate transport system permease small subunit